jgi:hypothetical protein
MYQRFVKFICTLCLLFAFAPVLRVLDITVFDYLSVIAFVAALLYVPKDRGVPVSEFRLAVSGIGLLALAGIVSLYSSFDPIEHIVKVIKLVVALGAVVGLSYVVVNRKILTVVDVISLLCIAATACSGVCILQGGLGLLTGLRAVTTEIADTTRMAGLAEHPLEAGEIAAFGIVMSVGMVFYTGKRFRFILMAAVNLVSIKYSASLTSIIGLGAAMVAFCIYVKAYRLLTIGGLVGTFGFVVAFSAGALGGLTDRLAILGKSQGNYSTLQDREMQWQQTIGSIDARTMFFGNGYSLEDLPLGLEIHNGLLAALFHFGVLGLLSQLFLIAFFSTKLRSEADRHLKCILLACLVIFLASYLTGPGLSRRSAWVPLMMLGAFLTVRRVLPLLRPGQSRFPAAAEPSR